MKKIINGKKYDTETAEKIHGWDNGYGSSDFKTCWEQLYRTKKGAFFLHGGGGPMSKYAVSVQGGMSGSRQITPLSDDEAKEWLENHDGDDDKLEELFGEEIEEA